MTENEIQPILTEKVVGRINNIVLVSVLLGVCISSYIDTFSHSYDGVGRLPFIVVGLTAVAFVVLSLEYLGQFRVKMEVEQ